ncbi:unnamed protein product [Ceutorhynchus assimilis]|uniref:Sm domain-containing protein n=1 Tax=Ceutorhynchus assimilis TaxID=467358 RepID=A0A9N9MDK2_9CUCU|nr:unnamed protein product [Ceutorhynchus assimilis]
MALINVTNTTRKEKSLLLNTLAGSVKTLENSYTTVDLRNEHCVTGKIVKVDGYMNLEMEDVVFYDMRGAQKCLATFYVCGRNIRQVHIPKRIDPVEMFKNQLTNLTRRKEKTKKVFKTSRAEKKNLQTIREAYK